ncbi:hypothetical protein SDC9_72596 [bioreactor metagenome]|uniref:Uncharacterized protein n=1 Tax=bioreactor metagenome TaxID=1076179 RepID=A0A644YC16_9ZZZZ
MSSIELSSSLLDNLPPPLPRVFENLVEEAVLAYRKRQRSLQLGEQSVRALGVLERPIESLLAGAKYYSQSAIEIATHFFNIAKPVDKEGAFFVLVAISQVLLPVPKSLEAISASDFHRHPDAVKNALWFYAAPEVCDVLLASDIAAMNELGVELAGLMTQARLENQISAKAAGLQELPTRLTTLLSWDVLGRTAPSEIVSWLQSDDLALQHTGLSALCISGIKVSAALMRNAIQIALASMTAHSTLAGNVLDLACALLCIHYPDSEGVMLVEEADIPLSIRRRCISLLGIPRCLIPELEILAKQGTSLSPEQRDLLLMCLGGIPANLSERPGVQQHREQALIELATFVFRENGCAEVHAQHLAEWTPQLLEGPLWPLVQIRLRAGKPWNKQLNVSLALDVSHRMRLWLYAEFAAQSGRSFPLLINDRASRQLEVLQTLEEMGDLFDLQ